MGYYLRTEKDMDATDVIFKPETNSIAFWYD